MITACAGKSLLACVFAAALAATAGGAQAAGPAPDVYLSLRGVDADRTIEVGEPLFVAVRLEVPFESKAAITLKPASGSWADAVEVVITAGGEAIRSKAAFKPGESATTLTEEGSAAGEWLFESTATRRLAPGAGTVQARLTVRDGGGWTGTAASEAVPLRIVAPGQSPARVLQRLIAQASEALAKGAPEDAARLLDPVLATQPDHPRLLALRAIASAQGGDLRAAQTCIDRATALEIEAQHLHPSTELALLRQQLLVARLTPGAQSPNPPAWTKLPASVRPPASPPPPKPSAAPSPAAAPAVVLPVTAAPPPTPSLPPAAFVASSAAPAGRMVPASELDDAKIRADAAGQWAATARAGSQYSSPTYGAAKATGAPDVPLAGNSPDAWCPGSQNGGTDWIELGFARPVRAVGVRVRQNLSPGAIVRVEAIASDGATHVWWAGVDPHAGGAREIVWFAVTVPATDYLVAKVKLTLNLAAKPDWEQIDAVQLVAAP